MELRHIEDFSRSWRRLIDDIIDEAQELDDTKERQIRNIVDDMEREVERSFERIKDVVRE